MTTEGNQRGTTYKHSLGHEDLNWLYITGPKFADLKRKSWNWEILAWGIVVFFVVSAVYTFVSDSEPTWIAFVQFALIVALLSVRAIQKRTPRELRKKAKQVRCPQIQQLASKENLPFEDVADAIRRAMDQEFQTVRLSEYRDLTFDPSSMRDSPPGRQSVIVASRDDS
ncbi:hypothetical protein [Arthrobacter monumenti]